jgi:fumarate reductase flavoprotein subunit
MKITQSDALKYLSFSLLFVAGSALAQSLDTDAIKSVYSSGKYADYLAGYHMKSGVVGQCSVCHTTDRVSDSQTEIDKSCIGCHGTYKAMGEKDKTKGKNISAHAGHLSIDSCTTCHGGHEASFAYCNNCHIFKMDMKFGRQKVPYVPQDLSIYKDAVPNRVENADVVIIGGGGAGIAAAIESAKNGSKTVLLEKMPIIGGSSLLSTGGMNVQGSRQQKEAGIQDSPELFLEDTFRVGKGKNDRAINEVLVNKSPEALLWFEGIGGKLDLDKGVYGGCKAPRMHYTKSGGIGRYMISVMKPELEKSGADVRVNSTVVRINKDANGAVTGVLVKGKNTGLYEIKAKSVILTSGSYANNGKLVAEYHPEFFGMVSSAQPGSHGDGLQLARSVGAQINHLERVQVHPNIAAGTSIMLTLAFRTNGGILVNKDGKRFANDNAPRNELGAKMLQQPAQKVWLIYDDAVAAKRQKVHNGYVRLGFVSEAATPEELAKKAGLPPETFAKEMQKYANFVKEGKDEDFGRKELPEPLNKGKLYAIEVIPAIGGTLGGVRANARTQVLDDKGNPIPNLFAAGEVVGNWHGEDRYGGNAVTGNIVFGRLAAQEAKVNAQSHN